jgi:phosphoribosyl 1,2-cyclic phosphodiesterase
MSGTEPNGLRVRFHGVRGSIPAPAAANLRYGGNTSCVEISAGSELLILDAGSGLRLLGEELIREAGTSPMQASLLLSHAHWDHIQGLPFFAPAYSASNTFRIFTAFGQGDRLHRALSNQMSPLHFPVGLTQMRGLRPPRELLACQTDIGCFAVRSIQLNHPGGCSGFRIDAAGASVAYLPDHEPYVREAGSLSREAHEALVRFVAGADLLILDTQYSADEYAHRIGWGHGSLPESVRLALEAGARRLFLFHHDPSHDDQCIDGMVETARSLCHDSGLIVEAATEGQAVYFSASRAVRIAAPSPVGGTSLGARIPA